MASLENSNLDEVNSSGHSTEANLSEDENSRLIGGNSWTFPEPERTPRQRFNPSANSQLPRRNVNIVLDMPNPSTTQPTQPDFVEGIVRDLQSNLYSMGNTLQSDLNIRSRVNIQQSQSQAQAERPSTPLPASGPAGGPQADTNEAAASDNFSFAGFFSQLMRTNPEVAGALGTFEKYIPFLLILVIKQLYDHSTGIFVCTALIGTFYHANSVVSREASRNGRRSVWPLLIVMFNLAAVIGLIYFVFEDEKLYLCAVFVPQGKVSHLSELLWIVGVNDFVLKFVSVIVKIFVILLPSSTIQHRKRGNYFLFIELTSQLHRTLVPIPVWLFYLLDHNDRIPAKVLGVILTAAYMVFKGKSILTTALAWKLAAAKLMQSTRYGKSPSHDEIKATGGICPICHDNLSEPTKLHCKHIFCEECVTMWFDREKTCPMCRAQVTEDPAWRDGSTSQFIQLF